VREQRVRLRDKVRERERRRGEHHRAPPQARLRARPGQNSSCHALNALTNAKNTCKICLSTHEYTNRLNFKPGTMAGMLLEFDTDGAPTPRGSAPSQLKMNARAKAEGLKRELASKVRASLLKLKDRDTQQQALLEMQKVCDELKAEHVHVVPRSPSRTSTCARSTRSSPS
jgi:hypothetical protein